MIEILNAITYLAAACVLFLVGKLAYNLSQPNIKLHHELLEKDNFAVSLSITGYYVGLVLCIGAAIVGPSAGIAQDLVNIGIYGGMGIVLLNISSVLNDKLIFRNFKISKELVEDRNAGTGAVEMANFIANGLIVYGAIIGEDGNLITALGTWAIAQILFIAAAKVYNFVLPYNIHEHIEKDNVAVGIGYGGALVAFANIIRFASQTEFETWQDHLLTIGIDAAAGFLLIPAMRLVTDKILLPGRNLTDEIVNQEHPNNGAALIEAFAYIGGSVLICFTL